MEIKAKGKLDQQSVSALSWFGIFKKYEPRKGIIALCIVQMIPTIYTCIRLLILTRVEKSSDPQQMFLAILPLLISTIVLSTPIRIPAFNFKKLGKLQNASCEYTFYDSSFTAVLRCLAGTKNYSIRYSELTKVGESSKHFFIFRGKDSFVVDKSTLENGTAEHLRHRFSTFENIKYTICNY